MVLLLVGLPGYLWPYRVARLGEQLDAIGSTRSWSEVEPADWMVHLTWISGIGASLWGIGMLVHVSYLHRLLPVSALFILGFPLVIWPDRIAQLKDRDVSIDSDWYRGRDDADADDWLVTTNRVLGVILLLIGIGILAWAISWVVLLYIWFGILVLSFLTFVFGDFSR